MISTINALSNKILDIREEDRFKLDPAFVDKFRGKQPDFGPVGHITFKRTYARPLEDGSTEEYWQTLERIVNGVYSVQRWHCRLNNLPWSWSKAQRSAQRMFQLMWDFKFLPGGRGLWMMGTSYVEERGSAALNNPLHEDTKILTREHGWTRLGDIEGQKVHVLSSAYDYGSHAKNVSRAAGVSTPKWVEASISHVERHPCLEIEFEDQSGNATKIVSSQNHRWFRRRTTKQEWERVATEELRVGDYVPIVKPHRNFKPSPIGFLHGMFFGDGTRSNGELHLFGAKAEVAQLVAAADSLDAGTRDGECVLRQCPIAWGAIPTGDYRKDQRYVWGFLAGYVAADGHVDEKGNVSVSSARRDELVEVANLFRDLGVRVSEPIETIHAGAANNLVEDRSALYTIKITPIDLDSKFFLRKDQRERWEAAVGTSKRDWMKVKSINRLAGEHPVLCAEVPGYEQFVIDGFILTSNCAFVSTENIDQEFSEPFTFLMDFSMLGVGVGGDCKGAGKVTIQKPVQGTDIHVVPDTREGWVELARRYLDAFVGIGTLPAAVDYSLIRPYGAPIKSFGGTAAGPEPLKRLVSEIQRILGKLVGQKITSEAIVDLFDVIGVCVVAGNVRRCLPGDTLIHTERGLVPIKDIEVGDMVLTSGLKSARFMPVTAKFDQGTQRLVEIKTQMGPFRCTPSHRVAVFTGCDTYDFKYAGQLEIGDRLVFVDYAIEAPGVELPTWNYDKPTHSTTCKDIVIPRLDANMAWFIGLFLGDGYVYANREEDGFNAHISVAVGNDHTHDAIADRVRAAITRFGVNLNEVAPCPEDNCRKIRAQSKQLAWYFDKNFKRPNEPMNVPDCILKGSSTIRAAFLAGLLDADGSIENRPTLLCASIYPKFLEQVQAVYASLGIPTRLKLGRDARGEWQALYHLVLVGKDTKLRFQKVVMPHSVKRLPETGWESQFDYGYPSEWVKESVSYAAWKGKWTPTNKQMTVSTFKDCGGDTKGLVPVAVLDVSEIPGEHQTYDIEVAGAAEFVANGLLVHNSAIIMFGEADDESFLNLKNPEVAKDAMMTHRWASNNSIRAHIGMDYTRPSEILARAGEPGFLWLENATRFGRMGEKMEDAKASGTNPCGEIVLEPYELCVGGKTLIQFDSGVAPIDSLVGKEIRVWNGDGWSTVKPRVTGYNRKLLRVTLSDGSFLDCTENHGWQVKPEGKRVFRRVEAKDLKPGDQVVDFTLGEIVGTAEPFAYEMGFFVGDGFVEKQSQAAIIPMYGEKLSLRDRKAIGGMWRSEQIREGLADPYAWLVLKDEIASDKAALLADKRGLPGFVFGFDRSSIYEFVAGYIDSDGTVTNKGSTAEGYRIYGSEGQMRDLQILLRRVNIDHATIRRFAQAGEETNYGVRNYDLWYCQIPSYECSEIPTRLKKVENIGPRYAINNAHPAGAPIDRARKQKIIKVEQLPGLHTTYCFDEPENHMGVFGNVLAWNCNLVETFPSRHSSYKEYEFTLKYAYLYAKTVSLIPTHNERTNAVMLRNRRIGISQSGIIQSFMRHGRRGHFDWCKRGYNYIGELDKIYSEWLCVRQSKRRTTVKPSGTVSLLPGVTPGIHYEHAEYYYRLIRVAKSSPIVEQHRRAGYRVEDDKYDQSGSTAVIYFPIKAQFFDRSKDDVTMWEQLENAAAMQECWSDNSVSITVTFKPHEAKDLPRALELFESRLKTVSFLPLEEHGYEQAPYITISKEEFERASAGLQPVDFTKAVHEETPKFCDADGVCQVPVRKKQDQVAL